MLCTLGKEKVLSVSITYISPTLSRLGEPPPSACHELDKETPIAEVRKTMVLGDIMSCINCGAVIPLKEQRQYIDDVYNACEARDKEDDQT